jgi:hypothetical protein
MEQYTEAASAGLKPVRPINSFVIVWRITRYNSLPVFILARCPCQMALNSSSEAWGVP